MRTQLSEWQIKGGTGGGEMKYTQVYHETISHTPSDIVTYRIPFPEGVEGINIKTVRVKSEQIHNPFVISIMDGNTEDPIYESFEEMGFQYDNVDIPYKPEDKILYVRIHNRGTLTTKFTIDIRGIEVV